MRTPCLLSHLIACMATALARQNTQVLRARTYRIESITMPKLHRKTELSSCNLNFQTSRVTGRRKAEAKSAYILYICTLGDAKLCAIKTSWRMRHLICQRREMYFSMGSTLLFEKSVHGYLSFSAGDNMRSVRFICYAARINDKLMGSTDYFGESR